MAVTLRYEGQEPMRVNRWLALCGVCSRREAEMLIARGEVLIDGARVDDPGRKIANGQVLSVATRAAEGLASAFSAVLNKPPGYVSGQPEPGRIPAARLLTADRRFGGRGAAPEPKASLPPLGRLDMDSRGLLLLSEDGVLARALIGPQSALDKEYLVRVRGPTRPSALERLRFGLELDGRPLKPAEVDVTEDGRLRFVLWEGRNRQIRRMCDLVGLKVLDLLRIRIGPLSLADLPEGFWRPLGGDERAALIAASADGGGPPPRARPG